jgi:hypothetical protein
VNYHIEEARDDAGCPVFRVYSLVKGGWLNRPVRNYVGQSNTREGAQDLPPAVIDHVQDKIESGHLPAFIRVIPQRIL